MTSLHLSDPSFFDYKDYQGNNLYRLGYQRPFRPLHYDALFEPRHHEPLFIELELLTFTQECMIIAAVIMFLVAVLLVTAGLAAVVAWPSLVTETKDTSTAKRQGIFTTRFEGEYRGYDPGLSSESKRCRCAVSSANRHRPMKTNL